MTSAGVFRRRARFEADRYAGDAWVFVRELLQNARDAGARRVDLTVGRFRQRDRIVCSDDGDGMSYEHARRYLFTLYASSKRDREEAAGRFGIGFWSVLRFDPDEVIVRSAPAGENPWEVRLTGDLEQVERRDAVLAAGTEIELLRPACGDDLTAEVWRAVRRDARYLRQCRNADEILDVRVNSRPATEELVLPPPSLEFRRPGVRGAVTLGERPRVDLMAHGLRVRSAATLDELLLEPERRRRPEPSMPDGLVPRLVLDSRRLQVLMARGDARTDDELRSLVTLGRRCVRRLVRTELDRAAGLGRLGRTIMLLGETLSSRRGLRALGAAVVIGGLAAAVAVLTLLVVRPDPGTHRTVVVPAPSEGLRPETVLGAGLGERYRGPSTDAFGGRPWAVALNYRPVAERPMLVAFRVTGLTRDGRPLPEGAPSALQAYRGASCRDDCLEVELKLDVGPGRVRLPVPTGHLLDPSSVRLDGALMPVNVAADGVPVLELHSRFRGRARYLAVASVERGVGSPPQWPELPPDPALLADRLRGSSADEAAQVARDWVGRRVRYDTSALTIDRHRSAAGSGLGFFERCLQVGAGDCDVQNALLAAVLSRAGVPARLAVGWQGVGGAASRGLHAWVEYHGEDGVWRMADASRGAEGVRADNGDAAPAIAAVLDAAADTSFAPVGDREDHVPTGGSLRVLLVVVAGLSLVLVAGAATVSWRRRLTIRHQPAHGDVDLAGLLRGAVARPRAYGDVRAVYTRKVVPILGDRSINLRRASALASRDRLTVTFAGGELARRAADSGVPVIDGRRREGRAVASVLGAVDLDRWDRLLAAGVGHPVGRRLERAAMAVGETWRVTLSRGAPDDVAVLDGPLAGLGRRHRVVVIDGDGDRSTSILDLAEQRPAVAALLFAELVVEAIDGSRSWKRRVLRELAKDAVAEQADRAR